ncbi:MAG: hypothetical protein IV100_18290 [Myxococcales bacterium]|nr:hypothetical protein [Myxococcales bacterium]
MTFAPLLWALLLATPPLTVTTAGDGAELPLGSWSVGARAAFTMAIESTATEVMESGKDSPERTETVLPGVELHLTVSVADASADAATLDVVIERVKTHSRPGADSAAAGALVTGFQEVLPVRWRATVRRSDGVVAIEELSKPSASTGGTLQMVGDALRAFVVALPSAPLRRGTAWRRTSARKSDSTALTGALDVTADAGTAKGPAVTLTFRGAEKSDGPSVGPDVGPGITATITSMATETSGSVSLGSDLLPLSGKLSSDSTLVMSVETQKSPVTLTLGERRTITLTRR